MPENSDKKWTLIHEPDTIVKGSKEVTKYNQTYVIVEYEKPTEGRFGKVGIPKDQLKEIKSLGNKASAKLSNKAGKTAGAAPAVNLSPRVKGWDKIKAIEPGTLPDLD